MREKIIIYLKILFAASALALGFQIVACVIVFVVFGHQYIDKVMFGIFPIAAWLIALAICWKYLSRKIQ